MIPSRPGLRDLLAYALPALAVAIAGPANTCVDSLAVGLSMTTADLAALGANVTVYNFLQYALTGIAMSTLSLVGTVRAGAASGGSNAARQAARRDKDDDADGSANERDARARGGEVVGAGLLVAVVVGVLAACTLWLFGERVLLVEGEVLARALEYLHVRALSLPLLLATMVANSALFAQKDTVTPAKAVVASVALNSAGNALNALVIKAGVAGVAWATVFAEGAVAVLMLRALAAHPAYLLRVPSPRALARFVSSSAVLCSMYVLKNTCYLLIQSAGVSLGLVRGAAHQAVWAVWAMFSFCTSPFDHTAVTFLSRARGDAQERRRLLRLCATCGASIGLLLGAVTAVLPYAAPWLLTPDTAVWQAMRTTSWQALIALALCGVETTLGGALIERGLFRAQTAGMLINVCATGGFLFSRWDTLDLAQVWWALVLFFTVRTSFSLVWLALLSDRADKRVAAERAPPTKAASGEA